MTVKTIEVIEEEIRKQQKTVDYDIKEYPIEVLIHKYQDGLSEDENEIYVPTYQRAFVWDEDRQSKFIESLILGLPIPYIFTAEMDDGRLEIVDGSQRIRTLAAFLNDKLTLQNLDVLTTLNELKFNDLSKARQRKFRNTSLRMITLSERSDDDARYMVFARLNTGTDVLKSMETRKGMFPGDFTDFIYSCAQDELFNKLTAFTDLTRKRGGAEELVLRFFAYSDGYLDYKGNVNKFLNNYAKEKNETFNKGKLEQRFNQMLLFVQKYFPNGFIKMPGSEKTPILRFEAISVGVYLALEENSSLEIDSTEWLDSEEFKKVTSGSSTGSVKKLQARIEYVKDQLLGVK